jgi:CO/xanthine dehydrogenase Mo-binding subunit
MSASASASATAASGAMRFGIGQAVKRVEDRRFVTGRARNVDEARRSPAVLCVLTGEDVAAEGLSKLRVVGPDVGGGFGMKADAYPEDALVLWASRECGRPVKWIATRSEALTSRARSWPSGPALFMRWALT